MEWIVPELYIYRNRSMRTHSEPIVPEQKLAAHQHDKIFYDGQFVSLCQHVQNVKDWRAGSNKLYRLGYL